MAALSIISLLNGACGALLYLILNRVGGWISTRSAIWDSRSAIALPARVPLRSAGLDGAAQILPSLQSLPADLNIAAAPAPSMEDAARSAPFKAARKAAPIVIEKISPEAKLAGPVLSL